MKMPILILALVASSTGCDLPDSKYSHKPTVVFEEDQLRDRAAFDLDCKADQLSVVALGNLRTAGVSGCDKRATYLYGLDGTWVMNTDLKK
jgi:hypothetical protein